MKPSKTASPEPSILRARARGEVSADAAFEQLYALYAPVVLGWLMMRVRAAEADDLFQDVWIVFYNRWRRWQCLPEMEAPEARPVLSFLFRTCHYVLQGHRRRAARVHESLESADISDGAMGARRMHQQVEFGRWLELARKLCPPQELDVLLAKLAGVPAREIAWTLNITEPVVDHRFRDAIARLRKQLQSRAGRGGQRKYA
jgi:RNA polymerase sigma factor (sigma-70 family)